MSTLDQTVLLPPSSGEGSALPVTGGALFYGQSSLISETLPSTEQMLAAREPQVFPGTSVTLHLPRTMGLIIPKVDFDLVLRYPWIPQPLKNIANNGQYAGSALVNTLYPTLAQCVPNTVGSDYALDPPVGVGWAFVFDTVTLQKSKTGTITDQMTANKLDAYYRHHSLLDKGESGALYDLQQGTGFYQCATALQPNLVPPLNVSGTRRATSFEVDKATNELIVRKHVTMEIPLEFGSEFPLQAMGDHDLIFSVNPNYKDYFCSNPRVYTGSYNLFRDSNARNASNTSAGAFPITGYNISPFFESQQTTTNKWAPSFCGSTLTLIVTQVVLDTADITELLGDAKLTAQSPFGPVTINGEATNSDMFPAASILSTGFTLSGRISSIDAPTYEANGLAGNLTIDTLEALVGNRILRDTEVSTFIAPSEIISITLDHSPTLNSVGTSSANLTAALKGNADLTEQRAGSIGRVIINVTDQRLCFPIWGADYSTIGSKNGTSSQTQLVRGTFNWPDTNSIPAAIWKPCNVNMQVDFTVVTNSTFARPTTVGGNPLASDANVSLRAIGTTTGNSWTYPLSIKPTNMFLENFRLLYKVPQLSSEQASDILDAVKSPEGLRVTRPAFDRVVIPLRGLGQFEYTYPITQSDVYYMLWSLRRSGTSWFGEESYVNQIGFQQAQMEQGQYQFLNQTDEDLAVNCGGKWPYVFKSTTEAGTFTDGTCSKVRGPGGSEETFAVISQCFGNSVGVSSESGLQRVINNALAARMRLPLSVIYGINTLGGAARLPKNTMIKFRGVPRTTYQMRRTALLSYQTPANQTNAPFAPVPGTTTVYSTNPSNFLAGNIANPPSGPGLSFIPAGLDHQFYTRTLYTSPEWNLQMDVCYRKQWVFTEDGSSSSSAQVYALS